MQIYFADDDHLRHKFVEIDALKRICRGTMSRPTNGPTKLLAYERRSHDGSLRRADVAGRPANDCYGEVPTAAETAGLGRNRIVRLRVAAPDLQPNGAAYQAMARGFTCSIAPRTFP
jgi:hypothetical protein